MLLVKQINLIIVITIFEASTFMKCKGIPVQEQLGEAANDSTDPEDPMCISREENDHDNDNDIVDESIEETTTEYMAPKQNQSIVAFEDMLKKPLVLLHAESHKKGSQLLHNAYMMALNSLLDK